MMKFFTERLFKSWFPSTNVVPKKGMLVKSRDNKSDYFQYVLITDVLIDEYSRCKFEFLIAEKTEYTDWMTIKDFNSKYIIQNPWI